jgi:ABC-type Mn2+/Zn2+ transport system ATPase subunit
VTDGPIAGGAESPPPHVHERHADRDLPAFEAGHELTEHHLERHAAIVLAGVSAGYDDRRALADVSFAVPTGSLLAVFGPNGGGKSTLLKVIAGLLPPWSGTVTVLGGVPGASARRIAYVPQAEQVDWDFPVTCGDVVAMGRYRGLGPFRGLRRIDRLAVASALRLVGMTAHERTQIGRLSGGQRRRVFLARAIAAEPDLYLLDEPVTGVDPTTQEELMGILEDETKRGRTVVATTHDLACAAQRFQRVLAINRTVVAHGPASLVLDEQVLERTYGGHLLVLDGRTVLLDDPHHHDAPPHGEQHFHEDAPGGRH